MNEKSGITLYQSEWRIMECLWESGPLSIVEVWHMLEDTTGWTKSTVNTLLGRMLEKGLIAYTDGRKAKLYHPCVARSDVEVSETKSMLQRVFRGSVGLMMNSLVENDELTQQDIEELYDILRKAEEAKKT